MTDLPFTLNTQRILIAVEDSKYSENAVRYGYHLAQAFNGEVALVHVIDPPTSSTYGAVDPIMGVNPVYIPEINEVQQQASEDLLNRLAMLWPNGEQSVTKISKLGQPRKEILETANEWRADLIVLGTHGRTGFDHFISGSVSEEVARHAICPVVIVPYKDVEP
ncbi:universal stress protein [Olivibacter sp. XZL3]|uniref:universal stress protein n=1 Tax=Olivibacter sp. XZL3 TaxID=1735116 RepID=UPI001066D23B|nr:universal stress protein [Olivibacter sp. XZL3]